MTTQNTTDRWARFLEDHAPGLTWLAATLLEWSELPPAAQRSWRVTVATTSGGDVAAIAAFHAESGVLAVAADRDAAPPVLAKPETVRRVVGTPGAVEAVFTALPMLAVRRLPGYRRLVMMHTAPHVERPAGLRKARPDESEELDHLREQAEVDVDPVAPADVSGATKRGLVWVLEREVGIVGMFRVEGLARRRVQIADVCVPPPVRRQGIGTALMRAAAGVARTEYAGEAVMTILPGEAAERTARRAGYVVVGEEDDVRLA